MPDLLRTNQEPQTSSLFRGQLEAAEGFGLQSLRPCHHGRHGRTSQGLIQGPDVVCLVGHPDDDQPLGVDPQADRRRGIELPGPVQHEEGPAFAARFSGGQEGEGLYAGSVAGGEPLDKRAPMEAASRQELVEGLRAAGDGGLLRSPGPFPVGHLLPQGLDQPAPHGLASGVRNLAGIGLLNDMLADLPAIVYVCILSPSRGIGEEKDEGEGRGGGGEDEGMKG